METSDWDKKLVVEPSLAKLNEHNASASLDVHLGNRFAVHRRRNRGYRDPLRDLN